ncbi:hypothetical protein [Caballeronia sp. LZ035]|uniref:hypothetical protein n=1 Tax=Caballeronia sp. LZ035 TaxID=3038568 RepID=UPI0028659B0A|nr:hypothetical protein [Caballeronia sp. LZ035]MDR5761550.1 hypothetical protein [Caballeronia sp. LZ035]
MKRVTTLAAAIFMLSACAGTVISSTSHMNRADFPGAQDASQSHPGTITMKYKWNGSTEEMRAADYPDFFTLYCYNSEGNKVKRSEAAWCIPVTEVETDSFDKQGKPADPHTAEFIEITVYGPGHTFLKHITGQPRSWSVNPRQAPAK